MSEIYNLNQERENWNLKGGRRASEHWWWLILGREIWLLFIFFFLSFIFSKFSIMNMYYYTFTIRKWNGKNGSYHFFIIFIPFIIGHIRIWTAEKAKDEKQGNKKTLRRVPELSWPKTLRETEKDPPKTHFCRFLRLLLQ